MNKICVFGSSGFIGQNVVQVLSHNYHIIQILLRDNNWQDKLQESKIFINLIGQVHNYNISAITQDYNYSNFELVKCKFN